MTRFKIINTGSVIIILHMLSRKRIRLLLTFSSEVLCLCNYITDVIDDELTVESITDKAIQVYKVVK